MLLNRQKRHADAVRAGSGKFEAQPGTFAGEELVRDLNEHAGPVAGFRIATAGSAVGEVDEYLNSLADYVVAFVAADAGYKSDAACVVLVRGIVQSLDRRKTVDEGVPRHYCSFYERHDQPRRRDGSSPRCRKPGSRGRVGRDRLPSS